MYSYSGIRSIERTLNMQIRDVLVAVAVVVA